MFDQGANRDAEIVLLWAMLVLSFPASILAAMAIGAILATLESSSGIILAAGPPSIMTGWTVLFISGYLQWFHGLPWIWGMWKRRIGSRA